MAMVRDLKVKGNIAWANKKQIVFFHLENVFLCNKPKKSQQRYSFEMIQFKNIVVSIWLTHFRIIVFFFQTTFNTTNFYGFIFCWVHKYCCCCCYCNTFIYPMINWVLWIGPNIKCVYISIAIPSIYTFPKSSFIYSSLVCMCF